MKKNTKKDRIKFVQEVLKILRSHKLVKKPASVPVKWRQWEVDGRVSVMLEDESEHVHTYTVFVRLLDENKNYKANGKCNFHDSPGDVNLSIERFRVHFNNLMQ